MEISPLAMTFSDFFARRPRLIIPRFQREYSWGEENCRQYLDDVYSCLRVDEKNIFHSEYFLGTMLFVLEDPDDTNSALNVVDGQQRLTTITILLSALSRAFHEGGQDGLAKRLFENYIIPCDDNDDEQRIVVTATSYPFFAESIQEIDVALCKVSEQDLRQPSGEEEELIDKTYKYFIKEFEEQRIRSVLSSRFNLDVADIGYTDILKAVRDQVVRTKFISIVVKSKSEGYRLFENLNSKGKPLSNVDMVKNRLFEKLDRQEPSDVALEQWRDIHDNVAKAEVTLDEFFHMFWRSHYKNSSMNHLYDEFIKRVKDTEYKDFLSEVKQSSRYMPYITSPIVDVSTPSFNNRQEFIAYVGSFRRIEKELNITQARMINLALCEAYDRGKSGHPRIVTCEDMTGLASFLERFLFAYSSVCSERTNIFWGKFSKFALGLHSCKKRDQALQQIREFKEDLAEYYPDKDNFVSKYVEFEYSGKGKTTPASNLKTRYALNLISNHYNCGVILPGLTVEHIAPDRGSKPTCSIGNLILLEAGINKAADTKAYEEKVELYRRSKSKWVKKFVSQHGLTEWDERTIDERSRTLAELTYDEVLKQVD